MGNCNSRKRNGKEPENFFGREKFLDEKNLEEALRNANFANRRKGKKVPVAPDVVTASRVTPAQIVTSTKPTRSYDEDAIDLMRYQLANDSEAFVLNNILLSVQFFENYEREMRQIKTNPINDREHRIDEAMVRHHKHVFFADRILECVQEHVRYSRRKGHQESLSSPRLFVIYDNVEASEPGDISDYSTVLDAPFYKLLIEECKEPGYVKLKKLEVLESTAMNKETEVNSTQNPSVSDVSIYTDSGKESTDSNDESFPSKGEDLLRSIKSRINESTSAEKPFKSRLHETISKERHMPFGIDNVDLSGRRRSGPNIQFNSVAIKADISNVKSMRKMSIMLEEEERRNSIANLEKTDADTTVTKSILKKGNTGKVNNKKNKENALSEDTEGTSGYRSNSSRNNESSETESDYGYSTITESTTPKRVELSLQSNLSASSGVLSEECWAIQKVRALDESSDEDDDDDSPVPKRVSRANINKDLYDIFYYLSSVHFMTNFVDNFMVKLGKALGLTTDAVNNALTQGASIYCDTMKASVKCSYEIIPAIIASWPNAANQWIIRERKVVVNPRNNLNYQWPTKNMVTKAINLGCLLTPVGFRPKRGANLNQRFQWKITFPAAERYLESCLAHSHIRCYLFTLALHKTFMESESCKIGIDSSHIKNHLFWQCEDNLAKWPEDRLGESLRIFLRGLYDHFGRSRLPNYFVESCNDFKGIPTPLLLKLQRRLHDILQSPVMHVLSAIQKLKYTGKDFYPPLNVNRLYILLTCKNPLRIANPNLPTVMKQQSSSESEDDNVSGNIWERAKSRDKDYQWKVRRQAQERRKAQGQAKKVKILSSIESTIDRNFMLPPKMEIERRRLVLEFFIPHFITMARFSEKFKAIKQAVIYLEQAQRLCRLLLEEPGGDITANEYLEQIREDLAECHRMLIDQCGYKIPNRRESKPRDITRVESKPIPIRPRPPKNLNVVNQDSPTDSAGYSAFSFVEVHPQPSPSTNNAAKRISILKLTETDSESLEESRL